MTRSRTYLFITSLLSVSILAVIVTFMPGLTQAKSGGFYRQTNLVSNIPGMAKFTDPNLKNPWGMSHSAGSPWWISDNNAGVATVYKGDGTAFQVGTPPMPLVVNIPMPDGTPGGAPTGNVFNGTNGFIVSGSGGSGPSRFIFATEDGTISGWNPTADLKNAIVAVDRSTKTDPQGDVGAVYKGLATGSNDKGDFIYATNFRLFNLVRSFTDSELSTDCPLPNFPNQCFAPFGIQNINGDLYVTFALLAPEGFGRFGKDVLVGNFGDGSINAFEPDTGAFRGQLKDQKGNPITIDDLWGLGFGNDGLAGDSDTLFFTAGINDEADGLFGSITHGDH